MRAQFKLSNCIECYIVVKRNRALHRCSCVIAMAGVVRWFKSGSVMLTKFSPLKNRDEGEESEGDHEMDSEPRSPERNTEGTECCLLHYISTDSFYIIYYNNGREGSIEN